MESAESDGDTSVSETLYLYNEMEKDLGISLWDGEEDLPPFKLGKENSVILNCDTRLKACILGHFLFGDTPTITRFVQLVLQHTGNVRDCTHPFDIIQKVLHIIVCGDITLDLEGSWSTYRESCIVHPWGTKHLRKLLCFPARMMDVRAKQAIASLISKSAWRHSYVEMVTNCTRAELFIHNHEVHAIYKHWKPLFVTLFLYHVLEHINHIKELRDVTKEFDMMISFICCKDVNVYPKDKESNGYISHEGKASAFHIDEVYANYNINTPNTSNIDVLKSEDSAAKNKNDFEIERMSVENAGFLWNCYSLAKTYPLAEIYKQLGGLLVAKLYPRAFSYRTECISIQRILKYYPKCRTAQLIREYQEKIREEDAERRKQLGCFEGETFTLF